METSSVLKFASFTGGCYFDFNEIVGVGISETFTKISTIGECSKKCAKNSSN